MKPVNPNVQLFVVGRVNQSFMSRAASRELVVRKPETPRLFSTEQALRAFQANRGGHRGHRNTTPYSKRNQP